MKRTKKILSVLLSLMIASSCMNIIHAEQPQQPSVNAIFEDFNDQSINIGSASSGGNASWIYSHEGSYFAKSNIIDSTAAADDYSFVLKKRSSGNSYLIYMPTRDGWNPDTAEGTVVETSFKYAVDSAETTGSFLIGLNMTDPSTTNANATPFFIKIDDAGNKINVLRHNANSDVAFRKGVNTSFLDVNGDPKWNTVKILTVFSKENSCTTAENTSTSDDENMQAKTGYVTVYLNGELLCEPYEFTYSGSSLGKDKAWKYKSGSMEWDNDGIWNLSFYTSSAGLLYIDDMGMRTIDYTGLEDAVNDAENEISLYGELYQEYQVKMIEDLIDDAKVYTAKTGRLLMQDEVDEKANVLSNALNELREGILTIWPDITENFDDEEIDIKKPTSAGGSAWVYSHEGSCFFAPSSDIDSDAAPTDNSLVFKKRDNGNSYLVYMPSNDGWGTDYPEGAIVETTFKYAVDNASSSNAFFIGLNMPNPPSLNENATPFFIKIDDAGSNNKISLVQHNANTSVALREGVNTSFLDANGIPKWNTVKILTVFPKENSCTTAENTSTSDDEGITQDTGYVTVYLNGEMLCDPYEFTYSGSSLGKDTAWKFKDSDMEWDNDGIWNLVFYSQSSSLMYIDDLNMHIVSEKNAKYKKSLEEAEDLLENAVAGDDFGQYKQADIDELKGVVAEAYTVYNNKTSDYLGNTETEALYTLFPQEKIDSALNALLNGIDKFSTGVNSESLTISKDNQIITAKFQKVVFEDTIIPARVIIAVFDEDENLLGVEMDEGDGSFELDTATIPNELSASIDITGITGATKVRAFAWNSLIDMEPIISSAEADINDL